MMKKLHTGKLISEYLIRNKWQFAAAFVCVFAGVFAGTVYAAALKGQTAEAMNGYLKNFVSAYNLQSVNRKDIFSFSVYNNIKTVLFMWLSGLWVYFLPVGAVQLFAKGCKLGFSTSVFVRIFGLKGIFFAFLAALPQFVAIIPFMTVYYAININFALSLNRIKNGRSSRCSKNEIYIKNLLYLLAAVFVAVLAAVVDAFVMPPVLKPVCFLLNS